MESHGPDRTEDHETAETPEDVAVLYSWANLHGAKYRDFSASRREYRAQLRRRAAEQVREQALLAQAEAEAAAEVADTTARNAARAASELRADDGDSKMRRSLKEAEEAARTAVAERLEAARRREAAAVAEASARREEREIAEAHASAERQAARFAESEIRRRALVGQELPAPYPGEHGDVAVALAEPKDHSYVETRFYRTGSPQDHARSSGSRRTDNDAPADTQQGHRAPALPLVTPRRPQGYRPDDASGVRQIYRGPEQDAPDDKNPGAEPVWRPSPALSHLLSAPFYSQEMKTKPDQSMYSERPSVVTYDLQTPFLGQRNSDPPSQLGIRVPRSESVVPLAPMRVDPSPISANDQPEIKSEAGSIAGDDSSAEPRKGDDAEASALTDDKDEASPDPSGQRRAAGSTTPSGPSVRALSPFSQALVPSDSTRGRRAQDDFDYKSSSITDPPRRNASETTPVPSNRPPYAADPAGPAWLYAPPTPPIPPKPLATPPPAQSSVAETLQHSRERVAARWFALKGVFEQPGQEQPEAAPVRQKETRTPVLAVFSLAGGVGKTSLVATVGRSLSSLGEKVLLTDTTSHGLLPFYFGASELRQGTVRTFSPPSGSTDAPIYLVSYLVDQKANDDAAQEQLIEEIVNSSRGTHRILLDLTATTSWIVRRISRMNPTILVPVAPDMNSVISLQSLEKFFSGAVDGDGRPLQPFYVMNQFDASLPLHLDVREVLRRQLGERLLPFVIRRTPAVSEALAEGMTVVDYAPDTPVAEDYMNVATWLRTVAAPATAGFRNVRWSER